MSLPEEEITRLFRARRTVLQMLQDRGYAVEKSELEMTRRDFIDKFGSNLKREDLLVLKDKADNPSDRIYVFFPEGEKSGVSVVKSYITRMKADKVWSAILVLQKGLTPAGKEAVSEYGRLFRMDVFEEAELLVNITEHAFVPQHKVLSDEEKKALLAKYTVKETQLPRILVTDPVARYYGLRRGQVVQITRESETAKTYNTYRCCI
ncbi:DNA-directed RNA polymerases II and IV subunit 5A-like [Punica granatum]|uniref:Uncharacterized protein n=2 Tax=Punica granatum TaxID=22663 RepID=A0A218XRM1_PUNGR|nr:DNA-directed RNA polymerases II and IV subunit 5A-like [Punica granatum]OWM86902.1 hypothetical protein CDL15_Pgr015938 [Punica granatum]PKI37600.1 hypothetical protein CRG98_042024 [Punica granatum]